MKGFTLIELLAVIVILAIILLIAVPTISSLIDGVKRNAFESSAKMIIKAADYYFLSEKVNGLDISKTFNYVGGLAVGDELNFNGEKPESGTIIIRVDGKVALAIHDGKYCAKKDYDGEVTVDETEAGLCVLGATALNQITKISAGFNYSMLLTAEGKVMVEALDADDLPFTMAGTTSGDPVYQELAGISDVKEIFAFYDDSIFFITNNGDIYGLGKFPGLGGVMNGEFFEATEANVPTLIPGISDAKKVVSREGLDYFIITESGSVYAWGGNGVAGIYGTLGFAHDDLVSVPTLLSTLSNVKDIVCGTNPVTYAVTNTGEVYGWGFNQFGVLPLPNIAGVAYAGAAYMEQPVLIPELQNINKIVLTEWRGDVGFAIRNDGRVFTWGLGANVFLGGAGNVLTASLLPDFGNVEDIATGFSHMLFLMDDSSVYVIGENYSGEVGQGAGNDYIETPTLVPGITALGIDATENSSVILTTDKKLLVTGINVDSVLVISTPVIRTFTEIPGVTNVTSFGFESAGRYFRDVKRFYYVVGVDDFNISGASAYFFE